MLDVARKDTGQHQTRVTDAMLDDLSKKMTAINVKEMEKEANVRQPHEDEDTSDIKELNTIDILAEDIDKLNIKPEDEDDDKVITRGPTGGLAVQTGLMMDKSIPVGPMCNYMPPQMPYQSQPTMKGNRRNLDDADCQPNKYFRPPTEFSDFNIPLQQGFQFSNHSSFGGCFTGTNDLSQGLGQPVTSMSNQQFGVNDTTTPVMSNQQFGVNVNSKPVMSNQQFGVNVDPNFAYRLDQNITTTKMVSSSKMSGGTVQSPVSTGPVIFGNNVIADGLLDEIDSRLVPISQGNLPNFTTAGPFSNNIFEDGLFKTKSFKEIRRRSDPDSGLDSDTGSPWSEAPSPSNSTYTSPPSVESGCGQSPNHESQSYHGSSPPKYPGVTSPGAYRASPSPANTSGYGSPGQPQLDDADLIDSELLDDAMEVIAADVVNDEQKKKLRPASVSWQQQVQPQTMTNNLNGTPLMIPNHPMPPTSTVQKPIMMAPNQMQAQMFSTQQMSYPVTTANGTAPQQIIIVQHAPQQNQPLIFVPVKQTPPQQQRKPVTQFKPILPKISQSSASSTTAGGCMTSTSGCKTGVTMSSNRNTVNNRTGAQSTTQAAPQNKLLMIARRTVADIPRDALMNSDEEGDTYLHIAVCKTDKHMVQALLERLHREKLETLVDRENHKRQTPLFLAVFINQPVMVAMFIRFQANVNCLAQNLSSDGCTTEVKSAIHVAASQGSDYHRTLVELLKAKDISINIVNNYGQTALHCAILAHGKLKRNGVDRIDSVEIIRTLINKFADPSAQDKKSGKTPLMYAIEKPSLELVDTILTTVHPDKVKNVVKTQAFDGSSCLKIAEGLKGSLEVNIWNKLWDSLQNAVSGSMARMSFQP